MGGVVSSGQSNDDLVDNLLEADYIKTPIIERVFRGVDRAQYFLKESRTHAYKDLAWKFGNIHLSAPCIYSEVMEALCLHAGLSFLNLGSGTGYLSTMVGLILGNSGINHGIEYYNDVIEYALERLEEFKEMSDAMDEFDFCEPKFVQGNCLCLTNEYNAKYDRIYCGAACPEKYVGYIKNLIKVGGILVIPLNDQLVQIKRHSEYHWESRILLPVSFSSLIEPEEDHRQWVSLIKANPASLQISCRTTIRNILRKNLKVILFPSSNKPPSLKTFRRKRSMRRHVPLFDSEESSEEDDCSLGDSTTSFLREFTEDNKRLVNSVKRPVRDKRRYSLDSPCRHGNFTKNNSFYKQQSSKDKMETDATVSTEQIDKQSKVDTKIETRAVIEHCPISSHQDIEEFNEQSSERTSVSTEQTTSGNKPNDSFHQHKGTFEDSINEIHNAFVDVLSVLKNGRVELDVAECSDSQTNEYKLNDTCREAHETKNKSMYLSGPSALKIQDNAKNNKKREKFDSGLGDEIVENHSNGEDFSFSSDEDYCRGRSFNKRLQKSDNDLSSIKWRRLQNEETPRLLVDSSSDDESDYEYTTDDSLTLNVFVSPYAAPLKSKIQELPLPTILKKYINYNREF